jgi:hypothetical protein
MLLVGARVWYAAFYKCWLFAVDGKLHVYLIVIGELLFELRLILSWMSCLNVLQIRRSIIVIFLPLQCVKLLAKLFK